MTKEHSIEVEAKELLDILTNINSFSNIEKLYYEYIGELISSLSDYKSWSIHSPGFHIFCACLIYVRTMFTFNMNITLSILKSTMANDTDPELRLKYFTLLSEYFTKNTLNENLDLEFSNQFLEDYILPGLIWTAGRVAEAIRTAAVSCLCAFLEKHERDLMEKTQYFKEQNICLVLDKIIPVLISLADDNSRKSRLYSLRAMYLIMNIRQKFNYLTEEHIHKIYPALLKRLDDGCDDVRLASLETLVNIWNAIPKNYDIHFNKGHIDMLYTTTIIYLDDPDSEFQNIILGNCIYINLILISVYYTHVKYHFR